MSHPLQQRVRSFGQRARRLLLLQAVASVVGLTVVAFFLLGMLDWFLRYQDAGVRFICSALLVITFVLSVYRILLPVIRQRWSDVRLAQHIEQEHPELGDRLSTTIAFVNQGDSDSSPDRQPCVRR